SQASIADVDSNASSWYQDTATGTLYIHASDDGDPDDFTVIAYFWAYFATKGIILNNRYYEPYVSERGIPNLSQSAQEIHWGICQIGSGEIELLNGRGYFDQIARRWIWVNRPVRISLGGDSLPYSEYTKIFSGKIIETTFSSSTFSFSIKSKSFDLLRTLPINTFWTSTYANLDPAMEGWPIPYYWGSYNASQAPVATCINSGYGVNTYQFKICDTSFHAIKSITQVYVDLGAGAGWETIVHANESLANATFTITSASFILGVSRVKVAFEGYHSGGVLIEGAPEIVEDILLNQCSYSTADLDSTSFTDSKALSTKALNVPVETETAALSIIEKICQSDMAFFDENLSGQIRYRTWEPTVTGTLPVLQKEDILSMAVKDDISHLYWKVKTGYSHQLVAGESLYAESYSSASRYKYERNENLMLDTYLRSSADAQSLADELNWITRDPSPIITLNLKVSQITKSIGDKIKVTLSRAPFETVGGYSERIFEIISKEFSCFPASLTLTGRDLMDWGNNIGFWTADTAPDWATATKQEKDDSGFWTDANGLVDSTDPASKNVSLWW
ncbi:MAG: hypothetical protein PHN75_17750, partial [Syntrophales bacterium]|nr:hypothetical protein [Syntrophales bacterium]